MVAILGLTGLRPSPESVARVTSPPYDVIKPGSPLEAQLRQADDSIYHVILGDDPKGALGRLCSEGALVEDPEPAYYVYEQRFGSERRLGVFVAAAVTPYEAGEIIRHEKTFDSKVRGRIQLRETTGYSFGPVFTLTKAPLSETLRQAVQSPPLFEFSTDLQGLTDLHGIQNRVWQVPSDSAEGRAIQAALAPEPLYIADGHHRYHASLRHEQAHFLCYVAEDAKILAYNRVLQGRRSFSDVKERFDLTPLQRLTTPPKHHFCIYTQAGCYQIPFREVPSDVVGRLDCSSLERELYRPLELNHDDIADPERFDYYPETALSEMEKAVDEGRYDAAVALHPVSLEELMAVADAGLRDSDIVMPEKSTFFSPKILTGLFIYKHQTARPPK